MELGFKKVVYQETDQDRVRVERGDVTMMDDSPFIIVKTDRGELWLNKSKIIAIKDGKEEDAPKP